MRGPCAGLGPAAQVPRPPNARVRRPVPGGSRGRTREAPLAPLGNDDCRGLLFGARLAPPLRKHKPRRSHLPYSTAGTVDLNRRRGGTRMLRGPESPLLLHRETHGVARARRGTPQNPSRASSSTMVPPSFSRSVTLQSSCQGRSHEHDHPLRSGAGEPRMERPAGAWPARGSRSRLCPRTWRRV